MLIRETTNSLANTKICQKAKGCIFSSGNFAGQGVMLIRETTNSLEITKFCQKAKGRSFSSGSFVGQCVMLIRETTNSLGKTYKPIPIIISSGHSLVLSPSYSLSLFLSLSFGKA